MKHERAGVPLMLFVAGSGRSGTSLFAGMVQRLGLHVPQPEVAAGPINPKGFAEPRWVVDFHGKLLGSLAVDLADARPEAWRLTAQATERRTRHLPRSLARYDVLLSDWRAEVDRVDRQLGPGLLSAASDDQVREAATLVDPALRAAEASWDDLGVPRSVTTLCDDVWSVLSALAEHGMPTAGTADPRQAELDELGDRYARLYHEAEAMATSSIVAARRLARKRAGAAGGDGTPR